MRRQVINKIKAIDNIVEVGMRSSLFMAKNVNADIEYYDVAAMKCNSIILKEGRMPNKFDEVLSTNKKNKLNEKVSIQWVTKYGKLAKQEFTIVGIAKNNLVSEQNHDMFIVSDSFVNENDSENFNKEAYILLNNVNKDQIAITKTQIEKIGVEAKNIHINMYYVYGIFGNNTQLLILFIFGVAYFDSIIEREAHR